jgi:hypothetical protein
MKAGNLAIGKSIILMCVICFPFVFHLLFIRFSFVLHLLSLKFSFPLFFHCFLFCSLSLVCHVFSFSYSFPFILLFLNIHFSFIWILFHMFWDSLSLYKVFHWFNFNSFQSGHGQGCSTSKKEVQTLNPQLLCDWAGNFFAVSNFVFIC